MLAQGVEELGGLFHVPVKIVLQKYACSITAVAIKYREVKDARFLAESNIFIGACCWFPREKRKVYDAGLVVVFVRGPRSTGPRRTEVVLRRTEGDPNGCRFAGIRCIRTA